MRKRKNRVVVELTTNKPLTQREARQAMDLLMERIDLQASPIWATGNFYAEKLSAKEFNRVLQAERRESSIPDIDLNKLYKRGA